MHTSDSTAILSESSDYLRVLAVHINGTLHVEAEQSILYVSGGLSMPY